MDNAPLVSADVEIEGLVSSVKPRKDIRYSTDLDRVPQFEASMLVVVTSLMTKRGPKKPMRASWKLCPRRVYRISDRSCS